MRFSREKQGSQGFYLPPACCVGVSAGPTEIQLGDTQILSGPKAARLLSNTVKMATYMFAFFMLIHFLVESYNLTENTIHS